MHIGLLRRLESALRRLRRATEGERRGEWSSSEIGEWIDESQRGLSHFSARPVLVTTEGVFIRTVPGHFMFFDPRPPEGRLWGIERTGEWEPEVMALIRRILAVRPGAFLDVGANSGYFALAVAVENPGRPVVAFEPIPAMAKILRTNWEINGRPTSIRLSNEAVGARNGEVKMLYAVQLSHVVRDGGNFGDTNVRMTTLDHYLAENDVGDVALVKCDVEGWECDVIEGAHALLELQRPDLVMEVECRWLQRAGRSVPELLSKVRSFRYEVRTLSCDPVGKPEPCETCHSEHVAAGEYWFTPSERAEETGGMRA